jgi:hypothetical protein
VAQKVTVSLVDDLSGDKADLTVQFGLDGKSYEIDLSNSNADKLRGGPADSAVPIVRPPRSAHRWIASRTRRFASGLASAA